MDILSKSLVFPFYRERAGFFLVVLFVAFGIMTSREHMALAGLVLHNTVALTVLFCLWALYLAMAVHYCLGRLHRKSYQFLFDLRLLPWSLRCRLWLGAIAGLAAPVVAYALFIAAVGFREKTGTALLVIPALVAALLSAGILVLDRRIRIPLNCFDDTAASGAVRLPFPRPANRVFWTLEWFLREKGVSLLLTKAATFFLIAGVLPFYTPAVYDLRFPAFLLLVTGALHAGLCRELFYWENEVWAWEKSLPLSAFERGGRQALTLLVLLLPDLLLALRYGWGNLSVGDFLQLFLFACSVPLAFYTYQYRDIRPFDEIFGKLFLLFVAVTFAILYHTPLPLLAVGLPAASLFFVRLAGPGLSDDS